MRGQWFYDFMISNDLFEVVKIKSKTKVNDNLQIIEKI